MKVELSQRLATKAQNYLHAMTIDGLSGVEQLTIVALMAVVLGRYKTIDELSEDFKNNMILWRSIASVEVDE